VAGRRYSAAVNSRASAATRPGRDFVSGIGLLLRGLKIYGRNPGLVILGLLPALIAFLLLTAAVVTIVVFVETEARWLTWFADDWSSDARTAIRDLAIVAIIGVSVLLAILLYTALTLAIGEPFYEKIAERVDDSCGGVPNPVDTPWYKDIWRGIKDAARLVTLSAVFGIALFFCGLIPVVGQTVVPVIGALIGGWAIAIELTGVAFQRRGLYLRQRRQALRRNRFLALGFGTTAFVVFLVPGLNILLMPAAVAGATLLTRRALGEPDTPVRQIGSQTARAVTAR
jgi:CysZ protein